MRGQISLEFSILLLGFLIVALITSGYIGIYGLNKGAEISSQAMAYAALSKLKQNIELIGVGDVGSCRVVPIKCPAGYIAANGNTLRYYKSSWNISTNCSVNVELFENPINISTSSVVYFKIEKINDNTVKVSLE